MKLDRDEIKRQASGRWIQILQSVAGLTANQLNPKVHGPCPKCGGTDRFRALDDVAESGGLYCNQCHNAESTPKSGDGLATVMWLRNCTFFEALKLVADAIGVTSSSQGNGHHKPTAAAKPAKQNKVHATSSKALDALIWSYAKDSRIDKKRKPDDQWCYEYADGSVAGGILRWNLPDGNKTFGQITKTEDGWVCGGMPEPRPLLNLPAVMAAATVYVCEGEKAAEALIELNLDGTTPSQGAKSPQLSDWSPLDGKRVVILPDNDQDGDYFAGRVATLIRLQAPEATIEIKLLKDAWPEIPPKGDAFDWRKEFEFAEPAILRERLEALPNRIGEYNTQPEKDSSQETKSPRSFAGIDASELASYATQKADWLVDGIFTSDEPLLEAARSKGCKTLQFIDLAVAIATGSKWMNHFDVPKRRKVLFISGETNYRRTSKHVEAALRVRGLSWNDIKGFLRIETMDFPLLPSESDQAAMSETVKNHGIELAILDPLYRSLSGVDSSRLNDVGSAIKTFQAACLPACMALSHHVVKSAAREYGEPPTLEDMTGAGLAETAGQWWLIGRNSKYEWNGMHDLCVQYGGREGQAGGRRILFNEREWTFQVDPWNEFIDESQQERQRQRDDAKRDADAIKSNQTRVKILKACRDSKTPRSRSRMRDDAGLSGISFGSVFSELVREQTIVMRPYRDGANRIQPEGYLLAEFASEYDKNWNTS